MTRFGVQLPNLSGFDPADLFDHIAVLATTAEEGGFDSVWVVDHFYQLPPLGGPDQPMQEASASSFHSSAISDSFDRTSLCSSCLNDGRPGSTRPLSPTRRVRGSFAHDVLGCLVDCGR
jgi:hypothetical protein